ncbi:expressed protein, partial [Phakopsora pachyrhizi]
MNRLYCKLTLYDQAGIHILSPELMVGESFTKIQWIPILAQQTGQVNLEPLFIFNDISLREIGAYRFLLEAGIGDQENQVLTRTIARNMTDRFDVVNFNNYSQDAECLTALDRQLAAAGVNVHLPPLL